MVVKRKPNSHVICIDPKKKTLPKKVQSKAELIEEIKALKALNDTLEEENKKNVKTILELEEKMSLHKKHKPAEFVNAGCQTLDTDVLLCEECEFPADTLYELGEHVGESHSGLRIPCSFCPDIYTSKEELEEHETEVHNHIEQKDAKEHPDKETFKCKFCEKCFKSKKELMKHNKDIHKENLSVCWNYEKGTCYYNDCWFSHEQQQFNETTSKFKCKFCESKFRTENEVLKHRKLVHTEKVPLCKNLVKGFCYFGNRCFFVHDKNHIEESNQENNEDKNC